MNIRNIYFSLCFVLCVFACDQNGQPEQNPASSQNTMTVMQKLEQAAKDGEKYRYKSILNAALENGEELSGGDAEENNVLHYWFSYSPGRDIPLTKKLIAKKPLLLIAKNYAGKSPLFVLINDGKNSINNEYEFFVDIIDSGVDISNHISDKEYLLNSLFAAKFRDYKKIIQYAVSKNAYLLDLKSGNKSLGDMIAENFVNKEDYTSDELSALIKLNNSVANKFSSALIGAVLQSSDFKQLINNYPEELASKGPAYLVTVQAKTYALFTDKRYDSVKEILELAQGVKKGILDANTAPAKITMLSRLHTYFRALRLKNNVELSEGAKAGLPPAEPERPLDPSILPPELRKQLAVAQFATALSTKPNEEEALKLLEALDKDTINAPLDNTNNTALHQSVTIGFDKLTEKLLEKGANPNAVDKDGETPLLNTLKLQTDKQLEIMKSLIKHKADVNHKDNKGKTLLMIMTENYQTPHHEQIKLLIDNKADVSVITKIDKISYNALYQEIVSYAQYKAIKINGIKEILKAKPDLEAQVGWGHEPVLHYALNHSLTRVLKPLIDAGAKVDSLDSQGNSALHKAYSKQNIKLLIENKASLNIQNNKGNTPLHKLASNEYGSSYDLINFLIDNGARVDIKNKKGELPRDLIPPTYIEEAKKEVPRLFEQ